MKVIEVPGLVEVPTSALHPDIGKDDQDERKPATFKEFLQVSLDSFKPLGQGIENVRQSFKLSSIVSAIEEPTSDKRTYVQFEDGDFKVVKAAVGSMEWRPGFARYILPYYEAVDKAQDVETPQKK